jgi:hypothetical protein
MFRTDRGDSCPPAAPHPLLTEKRTACVTLVANRLNRLLDQPRLATPTIELELAYQESRFPDRAAQASVASLVTILRGISFSS